MTTPARRLRAASDSQGVHVDFPTLPNFRRRAPHAGLLSAAALLLLASAPVTAVAATVSGPTNHNGIQSQTAAHTAVTPADISGNMTYHGGTDDGSSTVGAVT